MEETTKIINGVEYKVHTDKVSLHGKIHRAHPSRVIRNGAGKQVAQPLCGQRSSRFYPSAVVGNEEFPITCEKCLLAAAVHYEAS